MSHSAVPSSRVRIEKLLDPADRDAAFRDAALAGLDATPKRVPSIWLYDERGSLLFDEITRLPEYYLTRTERQILHDHAHEIARETRATTLVELGSGTSEKTRILLDALAAAGTLRTFAPLDVSEEVLVASAKAIAEEYPDIDVHAIVGDYERHLDALDSGAHRLFAFLGSTLGNFESDGRGRFLDALAASLKPADALLLGLDLVKEPTRLESAYNDGAGLSERFQRNGVAHLDRELRSDFSRARLEYRAFWDAEREWVDIGFDSAAAQVVTVPALGVDVELGEGERLRTQVSAKFRRKGFESELADAGLVLRRWWTDQSGGFALCLTATVG
jgi:L-histidine N-alpha-methyltransferase